MTGLDLRLARVRAQLSVNEMADRLGVSRQTIHAWEKAQSCPADRAVRYLQALEGKAA